MTICVQEKRCLLGNATGKNGAGWMVERWLHEIENKFPGEALDYYEHVIHCQTELYRDD